MRELIAIILVLWFGLYVWNAASSYDLQSQLQETLRPVAIYINTTQDTTPASQQQAILKKLIDAHSSTQNHFTRLWLEKLITKVQGIVDKDLSSSPWVAIVNALADTYTAQ